MVKTAADDPADKLLGIEMLRFASAVAVLVFHFQHFAYLGTKQADFSRDAQPFYDVLSIFYEYGFYGVQVFWCISGFIFYWKYAGTIADKTIGGYAFSVLRLTRLYPLHVATLLLVAILQQVYFAQNGDYFVYQYNDLYHFLLQVLLASNWGLQVGDSFNGPIWSISIEVLVYALFFVGLRWLSAAPRYLIGIIIAATLVILLKLSNHPFFYCVMFFYVGCLTAVVHRRVVERVKWKQAVTAGAIVTVALSVWAIDRASIRPLDFLIVFSPALVYLCVNYIKPKKSWATVVSAAGNITYASYLLHVPIQISVSMVFALNGPLIPWRSPVFFLCYLVSTLAISLACYTYFEMPMQRQLRKRLLKK